jgi:hypothetical protein|uniref:Uncharacterized protein n=1 Tax=Fagus sylvatica TaxID=28930 RepID=A0A2N9ID14_FAGSY
MTFHNQKPHVVWHKSFQELKGKWHQELDEAGGGGGGWHSPTSVAARDEAMDEGEEWSGGGVWVTG